MHQISTNLLLVINEILNLNPSLLRQSQHESGVTRRILKHLDTLALKLGKILRRLGDKSSATSGRLQISIGFKNVAFIVAYESPNNLNIASTKKLNGRLSLAIIQNNSGELQPTIALFSSGEKTYRNNADTIVYSFVFAKSSLFQEKLSDGEKVK